MFELTAEQKVGIETGEPVPCVVGATNCVVVRKDVFDRMQHIAYDDSEWSAEEMTSLAKQAFDDADTAGRIE